MSDAQDVLNQIVAYIKAHNLTQEKFAQVIGGSVYTVNKWLSGKRNPGVAWKLVLRQHRVIK